LRLNGVRRGLQIRAVAATGGFLAVLAFLPAGALAQATTHSSPAAEAQAAESVSIHLDPAQTKVDFTAGTFRHVHGTFQLKGGIFALDGQTGVADGEILVDAESEKSNDASIDRHIQQKTLETSEYPGIVFHPEKVTGSLPAENGTAHLKVAGSFTIHGKDHPLTLDVLATRTGSQVVFDTTFYVPYVKWGMKDASTFFMRDRNIKIVVESHGTIEGAHA
jgi:polyisoprenoid-binding protein YceI